MTKDDIYHSKLNMIVMSSRVFARTFMKMYPPVEVEISRDHNPYMAKDDDKCKTGCLKNLKYYEGCQDDWVTVEATLDAVKSCECIGHFYEGCKLATPHSIMLLHHGDLIGQALSKLTGHSIPYKKFADQSHGDDDWGIKMMNWQCTPENLNFADTEDLAFQVRAYIDTGYLGESGSTYRVQCSVKGAVEGKILYQSTGTFALDRLN